MDRPTPSRIAILVRYGALLAIFAGFLWLFYIEFQKDPPGSFLLENIPNGRGRNLESAKKFSVFMVLEFVFLLLVLSPHQGHQSKRRILLGLIPALIFCILIFVAGFMHVGSLYGVHATWMLAVCFIFYFCLFLAFFDDNYNLPSQGNLRIRVMRLLVLFLSGGLSALATLISVFGGFYLLTMFL